MNMKEERGTRVDRGTPITYSEKEAVTGEPQPHGREVALICKSVGEALWVFFQTEGV